MDQFEKIRQAATELHDIVVGNDVDPFDSLALVNAAADRLDLKLAWLSPGDPALKNARALFDKQSGMICCEEADSQVERALLVGHEIGHVKLHTGSSVCAVNDIDPSRSTEAAPIGLQRVEDYGARERRELQANIFAREFLLPRAMASRLHMEERLTATKITERTGLPQALVRQQLFDALLLPEVPQPIAAELSTQVPQLDPSQDRAATRSGTPFQLQAGPGTGKTRTLIKRISSLIEQNVDPSSILVVTFSNRAAGELTERLVATVPDAAERIWVGTFHAFGLDLIRRYHDRLGLTPNPPLFDRSDAIEILEELLPTLPLVHYRNLWDPAIILRDVVGAISRTKDEVIDPARYRVLAQAMLDNAQGDEEAQKAAEKCLEIAVIYDLYERTLRERGAVDFGDLIMRPTLLLEGDAKLRIAVQLRHRHVLVDEYQDINRASARLLKAVTGDGKHLWVVGDARQSIYRFRGASSANMVRFSDDYDGAVTDRLDLNYRSTKQIVDTVVTVAPRMGASQGMLALDLQAVRSQGPERPEIRRYETLEQEVGGIAASIRELEADGIALRDQAVLCRSNSRLNEIAAGLEARGIPVLHLGSLFERDEVRDLLALLSLAVDPFGSALVRVGAMQRYGLSLQDVHAALQHLRNQEGLALAGLATLSTAPGVSVEGCAGIDRLARDLAGLTPRTPAWEFLSTYLLDRTDLIRDIAQASMATNRIRAISIWQLLNFVREQSPVSGGLPIHRTLDRVRQLVLLAEERDLRQVPAAALHIDAVRLMTIHGSKGLEFEAVHVPGLTVSSFPSSRRGQRCPPPVGMIEGDENLTVAAAAQQVHEHEEQCLFFVALSRAKTYLRLHLARKQPSGKNRSASPFLSWLPSDLVSEIVQPPILPLPASASSPAPIEVTWSPDWRLTDSRLTAYEKCPRRFLYTHVIGIGNARKTTAFSQTHDCIHGLLNWLADARLTSNPTLAEAEAAFEAIWRERGPIDHAFAEDYRRLASRIVRALVQTGAGRHFRKPEPLAIDFLNGQILVLPNELADLPDGTVAVRRVRTGHKRDKEYDRLEYALYQIAAKARFGSGTIVEALHLTDETAEEVPSLTAKKLAYRHDKSSIMLADIAAGQFPTKVDNVTCPRCPHFFICAATPAGTLRLH